MPETRFPGAGAPFLALLAFLLLGACSSDDPTGPGEPGLRAEVEARRARWEDRGFRDYAFTLRRVCFCPPEASGPVRVEVRQGAVVRVVDPASGTLVDPELWHLFPSVEGIFTILLDAVDRGAHQVDVEWDDALSHPRRVFIDYDDATADEELGFEVEDVEGLP